jgi:hypothetical protein
VVLRVSELRIGISLVLSDESQETDTQKMLVDLSCCMKADMKDCCARERHLQELVVKTAGLMDLEHATSA